MKKSFGIGDIVKYKEQYFQVTGWKYSKVTANMGPNNAPLGKVSKLMLIGKRGQIAVSPKDPDLFTTSLFSIP